jgi:hypothetical protein
VSERTGERERAVEGGRVRGGGWRMEKKGDVTSKRQPIRGGQGETAAVRGCVFLSLQHQLEGAGHSQ